MRPVSYNSRSLTATEQRYAQIEKEVLAFTWGCERFADYLVGLRFTIETDHKPLVPLFSYKNLDELPLRVQRFRMRMRFLFSINYVPGKSLIVADTLSRAPLSEEKSDLQDEADAFLSVVKAWLRKFNVNITTSNVIVKSIVSKSSLNCM